jgi:hypothetical protein
MIKNKKERKTMNNEEKAKRIKKIIGEDKDHFRPADIIADIMHYCKFYTDIEDGEMYHDFEYELKIARGYYQEETNE